MFDPKVNKAIPENEQDNQFFLYKIINSFYTIDLLILCKICEEWEILGKSVPKQKSFARMPDG